MTRLTQDQERVGSLSEGRTAHDGHRGNYGVIVIGRNEGERLRRCLASVVQHGTPVVYVDSGSDDGSIDVATDFGALLVTLDSGIPFTAARARNEGFDRLRSAAPELRFALFIDGDCEVNPTWPQVAINFLSAHPDVAAACGRRRERFPEHSVYNRLCDLEWDTPVGETPSCGGDVMMRIDAFLAQGGFRNELIAGEEPELCVRLRLAGWRIWRIQSEMTLHDAALLRFDQWWRRARRGGHAFAELAFLHGAAAGRPGVTESWRALLWGLGLPCAVVLPGILDWRWLLLTLIYPAQVLRLAMHPRTNGSMKLTWALYMVVARFAEAAGVLQFHWNRLFNRKTKLIEYK